MSDHLTNEDLDAIEACANAATPGPWEADGLEGNIDTPEHGTIIEVFSWSEADAEFIAAARTDVPALIAEVRRLRQWKAEALPVLDGLQELGRALDLPIGARITGPAALKAVERLRAQRREALALANPNAAQWERDNHTPTIWAGEIRDALEADDE